MAPVRLVLASASPARLRTLRDAGISPTVVVSDVNEDAELAAEERARGHALSAPEVAELLARAKSQSVAAQTPDALVLGCDSVLELGGSVLGKPGTPEVARQRWRAMRGRSGVLHTGHWVTDTRSAAGPPPFAGIGEVASTRVWFADLRDDEIEAYVESGEPLQVAGAFTIDGLGGAYVERIDGDPHTVVGVGLPLLRLLLDRLGVPWHSLWG